MDLKSELRNLKLRIIKNEFNFKINKKLLLNESNTFEFISKVLPNDIITGSIALRIFGLINRESRDIDILIKDKDRYRCFLDDYDDDELTPNRLGYHTITHKKGFFSKSKDYKVDFFKDTGSQFIEFDYKGVVLKVHNPLELMSIKMSLNGTKHKQDMINIFTNLDNS